MGSSYKMKWKVKGSQGMRSHGMTGTSEAHPEPYHSPYLSSLLSLGNNREEMGYWQDTLAKVGLAQAGPKITAQDRAILE
jgi:hypothetical protein